MPKGLMMAGHNANARRKNKKMLSTSLEALIAEKDVEEESEHHHHSVGPPFFDRILDQTITLAITLNAITMGVSIDTPQWDDDVWIIVNNVFTAIFFLEMWIKLWFLRKNYFLDSWNVLDFVIVWIAVLDDWIMQILNHNGGLANVKILRILKMLRLLRAARMVKILKLKKELMIIVNGLWASLKSMCWVTILLVVMIYASSIFIMDLLEDRELLPWNGIDEQGYFETLPRAMITLFGISIFTEWAEVIWPIYEKQPALIVFFIMFVTITSFGILNLIIGVITERTAEVSQGMKDKAAYHARLDKMIDFYTVADSLFKDQDSKGDGSGQMSYDAFALAENDERIYQLLEGCELPHGFRLKDLHVLFDVDCTGYISKEEFLNGIFRLVFCSQFQQMCLSQQSLAQVRKMLYDHDRRMKIEQRTTQESILKELRQGLGEEIKRSIAELKDDVKTLLSTHEANKVEQKYRMPPKALSPNLQQPMFTSDPHAVVQIAGVTPKMHTSITVDQVELQENPRADPGPGKLQGWETLKVATWAIVAYERRRRSVHGFGPAGRCPLYMEEGVAPMPGLIDLDNLSTRDGPVIGWEAQTQSSRNVAPLISPSYDRSRCCGTEDPLDRLLRGRDTKPARYGNSFGLCTSRH